MDRLYFSGYYVKTLHYFFFSFAVFALTAGIVFSGFAQAESLSFFGMTVFYFTSSILAARRFYREYREIIEPFRIIKTYFLPYLLLAVLTVISVTILVTVAPSISGLVFSFLFINYYMLFVSAIGYAAGRFKFVSRFFEMYSFYVLREAKNLACRYALFGDVKKYKVGSDQRVDRILDEIWAHRSYPLPHIRMLETAICEKRILEIEKALEGMKGRSEESESAIAGSLEGMKEDYHRKIREIEQKKD
jgi:hypothetical protein